MEAEVVWTPTALADLTSLLEVIARHSAKAALKLERRLYSVVGNLSLFPESGRRIQESMNPDDREIIVDRYRVAYVFDRTNRRVFITHLHHSSRMRTDDEVHECEENYAGRPA